MKIKHWRFNDGPYVINLSFYVLRIMKLTIFLFLLFTVSGFSKGFSQKVNINVHNEHLINVIKQLRQQTDYGFVFNAELLKKAKPVTVQVKSADIQQVLEEIFENQSLEFEINDKTIFIQDAKHVAEVKPLQPHYKFQNPINGRVLNAKGEPLQGATIYLLDNNGKRTSNQTSSNEQGDFTLLASGDTFQLEITYVGFLSRRVTSKKEVGIITLQPAAHNFDEVVVVGYGSQKREDLTGSIATVQAADLVRAPFASTSNALSGRLPGLITVQSSGQPGFDAADLSIRGFGNALIIVDGIEMGINQIDPESIESVSILKDGAASIYGARAGNGVILVTTKKGLLGKPVISFNSSQTFQGITAMQKPVSAGQYTEIKRQEWLLAGKPADQAPFSEEQVQKYYEGTDPAFPNTDWLKHLTREWAPQQQYGLTVRGGTERINFYGLIGYLNQESMWKENGGTYKRYNFQTNVGVKILDNLNMEINLSSWSENRNMPVRPQSAGTGGVWLDLWATLPIYPATLPDPSKISYAGVGVGGVHVTSNSAINGHSKIDTRSTNGTISLKYDVKQLEGLSAKGFFNYQFFTGTSSNYNRPVNFYTYEPSTDKYNLVGSFGEKASLSQQLNQNRMITGQLSLNYQKKFAGQHAISGLALYEAIDYEGDYFSAYRNNFISTTIQQLFGGSTQGMSNNGSAQEMGRASFVGRLNYNYAEKYLLEAIFRADASAKFPKSNRWGYFPGLSLGWQVSKEEFFQIPMINNLKIRASYGESGNDAVGNFQYLEGYKLSVDPVLGTNTSYIFGQTPYQGIYSTGLANPNLTWERLGIYNAGLDFELFNHRLYGTVEAFYRTRSGILGTRANSLPSSFGALLPPENLNSLSNRGFEALLGTRRKINDFQWDINANIGWTRAKWTHFDEPDYADELSLRIVKRTGRWVDEERYGWISDGLFMDQKEIDELTFDQDGQKNASLRPGDIRYKDLNGDGVLNQEDFMIIGKGTTPQWTYGITGNLEYKNFNLSFLLQGASGYYYQINLNQGYPVPSTVFYENLWREGSADRNSLAPRLSGAFTNAAFSDHYYRPAGYLRLKVLSLGYNLPSGFVKKLGADQCRFNLSGTNLLTFDRLKQFDIDPESPSGLSGQYYPQQRTITAGVNLSF